MLVARRYTLRGHVQGVGFRLFADNAAQHEGIKGWVENRPDGSIEIFAEGDREAVDRFEAKIRRGPSHARIDRVYVSDETPSGRAGEFTIRA